LGAFDVFYLGADGKGNQNAFNDETAATGFVIMTLKQMVKEFSLRAVGSVKQR
jgi:hypothetical protein